MTIFLDLARDPLVARSILTAFYAGRRPGVALTIAGRASGDRFSRRVLAAAERHRQSETGALLDREQFAFGEISQGGLGRLAGQLA